jgi:hypothetical protein
MPKYFIVKHDLESFKEMPGFIWNTSKPKTKIPVGFRRVRKGDRWIEFAYIKKDEIDREPCSLVTGFYECVETHWYGNVPLEEARPDKHRKTLNAHMIKGEKCDGYQPRHPVTVPSIREMLGKNIQPRVAVARIEPEDFRLIRQETRRRELDPSKIPLFKREPLNEQEVLSVVVRGYQKLGIEKIIWARTRFPDLLVKIKGKDVYVELEVDSLGFWDHIEKRQLRRIRKGKFAARVKDRHDNKPVALLCWVDGDRERRLRKCVPDLRVFELQSLLRAGKKINGRW